MKKLPRLKKLIEKRFTELQDYSVAYNKLAKFNKDKVMSQAKIQL